MKMGSRAAVLPRRTVVLYAAVPRNGTSSLLSVRSYASSNNFSGKKDQSTSSPPNKGSFDFSGGLSNALRKGPSPASAAPPPPSSSSSSSSLSSSGERKPLDLLQNIVMQSTPLRGSREGRPVGNPPPLTPVKDSQSTKSPAPKRLDLQDLKYYKLYPRTIKRWVTDCKTPRGIWDKDGSWRVLQRLEDEIIDENAGETEAQRAQRAILEGAKVLPADLRDRYRFGVTEQDIKDLNLTEAQERKLKEVLSFQHAGRGEINDFRIAQSVAKWQRKPNDTGSSEVQIAVLTEKIRYMSDHLRQHHKDQRTKRALGIIIDQRRALLKHLKKQNVATYYTLLRDLNLRDMVIV